jgi:nicotinic acid phosphoribosyltransferase
MDSGDLADVVAEISAAVASAGFPDRAAWLDVRVQQLRSGDDQRRTAAAQEVRSVVHGMGGLLDIWYGSPEETQRIGILIDHMWTATRMDP